MTIFALVLCSSSRKQSGANSSMAWMLVVAGGSLSLQTIAHFKEGNRAWIQIDIFSCPTIGSPPGAVAANTHNVASL